MDELPPIPEILHSIYHDGPFPSCVSCDADLADPGRVYQVQKIWRHGEVVFELALCGACAAETVRGFSKESLSRMQEYFAKRLTPTEDLTVCHLCGKSTGPDGECEMAGTCRGLFLVRPVVVACATCSAAAQELLSEKTRDAWGEFVEDNLPGVPLELEPAPFL